VAYFWCYFKDVLLLLLLYLVPSAQISLGRSLIQCSFVFAGKYCRILSQRQLWPSCHGLLWANIHSQYCASLQNVIATTYSKDENHHPVSSQDLVHVQKGSGGVAELWEKLMLLLSLKICLENLNAD